MVWKNSKMLKKFCVLVLITISCDGYSQTVEAEWRVINAVTPTVVPMAPTTLKNLFPTRYEVQVTTAEPEKEERDLVGLRKAELLEQARQLLETKKAFTPNVRNLYFKGFIDGKRGRQALYEGRWLSAGDRIAVPVEGSRNIGQLIAELARIDTETANMLQQDLDSRLSSGELDLKITNITADEVSLQDGPNKYTVTLSKENLWE